MHDRLLPLAPGLLAAHARVGRARGLVVLRAGRVVAEEADQLRDDALLRPLSQEHRQRRPQRDPVLHSMPTVSTEISGAHILITDDLGRAVKDVDFVYTDVWVSMGEAESVWEERLDLLGGGDPKVRNVDLEPTRPAEVEITNVEGWSHGGMISRRADLIFPAGPNGRPIEPG